MTFLLMKPLSLVKCEKLRKFTTFLRLSAVSARATAFPAGHFPSFMAEAVTFQAVSDAIRKGRLAPVYMLHGEEGFYIDALSKCIEETVPEADRDFNLTVLYASQTEPAAVIEACRRYPMMTDRQVVILREAQGGMPPRFGAAAYLKALAPYVAQPSDTTVLCICFRGAEAKSAEFFKALPKGGGMNFLSRKLNDRTVGPAVTDFVKSRGLNIEPKALAMLCDYVGADLSRLYNEVGKLTVSLGQGAMITPEAIERNIGISKDYNAFELVGALATGDAVKAFTIVEYFRGDPKNNPVQPLCATLFNYFSNLLIAWYTKDRSERSLMQALGFRWPGQLRDITAGMRRYGPWQAIEIISLLRVFDGNTKGNGSRQDPYDLLTDLVFHILNPIGEKAVNI